MHWITYKSQLKQVSIFKTCKHATARFYTPDREINVSDVFLVTVETEDVLGLEPEYGIGHLYTGIYGARKREKGAFAQFHFHACHRQRFMPMAIDHT